MEKFKNNYGGTGFQGVWIPIQNLNEGIQYVKENDIRDIFIYSDGPSDEKHLVDFEFLEPLKFLKSFHIGLDLSKKSNINGIYYLINLKDFAWGIKEEFPVDFSKLSSVETLSFRYSSKMLNLQELKNLKSIKIRSLKADNCIMLKDLKKLVEIDLTLGGVTSLKGLSDLPLLKKVWLSHLSNLIDIEDLASNENVEQTFIENCKSLVDLSAFKDNKHLKYLSIHGGQIKSLDFVKKMDGLEFISFTNIEDGNLSPLLSAKSLKEVAFTPDRNHYSHSKDELNSLLKRRKGNNLSAV